AGADLSRLAQGDDRNDREGTGGMNVAARPDTSPDAGLVVSDVAVTYRNGGTAIRDMSFALPRGTITPLVHVNGSGKATLFGAIMGCVPLAEGGVAIFGEPAGRALKRNIVAYDAQAEEVDWNFPVLVED